MPGDGGHGLGPGGRAVDYFIGDLVSTKEIFGVQLVSGKLHTVRCRNAHECGAPSERLQNNDLAISCQSRMRCQRQPRRDGENFENFFL